MLTLQKVKGNSGTAVASNAWDINGGAGGYSGGDARMMSKGDTATDNNAAGDEACRK